MIAEKIGKLSNSGAEPGKLITGSDAWSYGEFLDDVNKVAVLLENNAPGKNEPVGLAFPNSKEFLASLLAAEQTDHPAVLLGAGFKSREIAYHIENSGIRKILAAPHLAEIMQEIGGTRKVGIHPAIDCWVFDHDYKQAAFMQDDFICQLTSGTNGLSKAAVRTKEAFYTEICEVTGTIGMSTRDTVLVIPPMHHSYGLMAALCSLLEGAALILTDGFMPAETIQYIKEYKVTILFAVPFMYHLLNQAAAGQLSDFDSLRYCISAGAPLHKDTAAQFTEYTGKVISQIYGSTETGVITLHHNPLEKKDSVGKAIGKRLVKVFDENGRLLPPETNGELRTLSKADARAYLYPADLNDRAFRDGWFLIGDLGSVDAEGYVYIRGRKSSIINVAGMKVDPVEVEKVITSIPGVKEAVVIGIDTGSGGQIVKAVVVKEGTGVDKKTIIEICRKNLSSFKVPRVLEFMDEIPRSPTGKILRKYLE